jgi:hypothetical protein
MSSERNGLLVKEDFSWVAKFWITWLFSIGFSFLVSDLPLLFRLFIGFDFSTLPVNSLFPSVAYNEIIVYLQLILDLSWS